MPCRCRTRASTRPPRPAPTTVIGVVIALPRNLLDCYSNDASTSLERRSMCGRMELMATKARRAPRRTEALSRDVIVQAATEILDAEGEDALTLRALTVRLATGYGAIYHHVADRDDLLAAATDHVIARIVTDLAADAGPRPALRGVAVGLFDAILAHPWAGDQLNRDPLRPALLDIYEGISQQLQALGVAGQNAANARALANSKMDRSAFLAAVAAQWAQLDPDRYPSVHKARTQ